MLPWMNKKQRTDSPVTETPPMLSAGERIYAIGDIHGRVDLLARLFEMIAQDMEWGDARNQTIVFLGDYIDRGPDTAAVLDLLNSRPFGETACINLIGNHEAVMLQFLQDAEIGRDWVRFGGEMTLASYGVHLPEGDLSSAQWHDAQSALKAALPEAHLAFLRDLKLSFRAGGYLFVHAGLRPGVPLAQQDGNDLIWIRNRFLDSTQDHGFVVVHGHSPDPNIQSLTNRIGIDTGAYFSGKLTAAVLEGNTRRFLAT